MEPVKSIMLLVLYSAIIFIPILLYMVYGQLEHIADHLCHEYEVELEDPSSEEEGSENET